MGRGLKRSSITKANTIEEATFIVNNLTNIVSPPLLFASSKMRITQILLPLLIVSLSSISCHVSSDQIFPAHLGTSLSTRIIHHLFKFSESILIIQFGYGWIYVNSRNIQPKQSRTKVHDRVSPRRCTFSPGIYKKKIKSPIFTSSYIHWVRLI